MTKPQQSRTENLVITVAAGYTEAQIRPFVASLQNFSPQVSLRLIVDRHNPEFQEAVRAWFQTCSFHLLPTSPLRDFTLKRKWARSMLKRTVRWSRSRTLGRQLLPITSLRHIAFRDLLASLNSDHANILVCDSRDVVFQSDPFLGEWPALWTCEEDRRIEECGFNSSSIKRAAGDTVFQQTKQHRIICAGVVGGRLDTVLNYFRQSSQILERDAAKLALIEVDQGIHNYLVRLRPELGFTVLPNGRLTANLAYTNPADLTITGDQVMVRSNSVPPAILHQYDRHPNLAALVQAQWANSRPPGQTA